MLSASNTELQTAVIFLGTFISLFIYWKSLPPKNYPPGPKPWPLVGNLPNLVSFSKNILQVFKTLSNKYGPIIGLRLGSQQAIVLNGVDAIKDAFLKNPDAFSTRPSFIYLIRSIVWRKGQARGVIWANGTKWKEIRRFTLQSLRDFGVGKRSIEEKIQEESECLCNEIAKYNGKPYDITVITQSSVSNVICSICFGARFEFRDPKFEHLISLIRYNVAIATFVAPVNFFPWLRYFSSQKWVINVKNNILAIEDFVLEQINEHRESFDSSEIRDFVDLYLMKEREGYDDQSVYSTLNLKRVITDLFIAGTETTSTTVRWLLIYMCLSPGYQKRCQSDIDSVIGNSRRPCSADRAGLPFIEAVINETLRIAAVVPLGVPHCTEMDTILSGYNIPKDTLVLANINSAHRDPAYWEEPEEFRPERWLSKDGKFQKRDGLLTFSIGPRTCMGESLARNELFLFFCSIMQRFNVSLPEQFDVNANIGVTFAPKSQNMIFTLR